MKFDFIAVEKLTGRKLISSITIADPIPAAGSHGDFSSQLTFEGFDTLSTNVHGAFSFQAAALAFNLVQSLMASHAECWEFHFGDDGPAPFDWGHQP